ncbi:MAG: hypothetical protein NUV73_03450 [Candidatus Daviesbacteria bacterium]|nr:hypothetical protein [Candidatus Daviesbacteria bacterium]
MEKEDNSPSLIVGNSQFGLTQKDVINAVAELQSKIAAARDLLSDPDGRIRKAGYSLLSSQEKSLQALTSDTPEAILVKTKGIYDKAKALELSGISRKEIAIQISKASPEINNLYALTSTQDWGYHLGQEVKGLKFDAITK